MKLTLGFFTTDSEEPDYTLTRNDVTAREITFVRNLASVFNEEIKNKK